MPAHQKSVSLRHSEKRLSAEGLRFSLTPQQRLHLIRMVQHQGVSISRACKDYGVSRPTFYKWIVRYDPDASDEENLENLSDRRRRRFPKKKTSPEIEDAVKKIVLSCSPKFSKYRLYQAFLLRFPDKKVGLHGFYNALVRSRLNTPALRKQFLETNAGAQRAWADNFSPVQRMFAVERVLRGGLPVAQVARELSISRATLHAWIREYRKAPEGKRLDVLGRKVPSRERWPGQATVQQEDFVLQLVSEYPGASKYELARLMHERVEEEALGAHGVYNILRRHGLTRLEQRVAWVERFSPEAIKPAVRPELSWTDRVRQVFEEFLPSRAPAGPPAPFAPELARLLRFAPLFLFSSLFLFGLFEWGRLLSSAPTATQALGWILASLALSMGTLFFLYSLKYYFTLAVVLSFSREASSTDSRPVLQVESRRSGESQESMQSSAKHSWISRLFGIVGVSQVKGSDLADRGVESGGLKPHLEEVELERRPFISVHLPMYNEKRVAERVLKACTSFAYDRFEVVVVDDSTDETTVIVERFADEWNLKRSDLNSRMTRSDLTRPRIKVIHRESRAGFKGGALKEAMKHTDPRAEFVVVFDADFVPYPDTLELFLKYFQVNSGSLDPKRYARNAVAAIQGYQWHVLNKSENWITRGVRSEYAGSYVIERSGEELYGGLKQIAGSVYMIRRDLLDKFGWGTSLTEDFELTLRLYEQGYKVVYTPYIQAPAECASTLKRLIRQRMRWAEGHSFNIKKMFPKLFRSTHLSLPERLEVLYLSPYYLQAAFFMVGTFGWLISETLFRARLPFWTSVWGWSLVLTNLISLPLMNAVGLFLEEAEERDFVGLFSFVLLSYILIPFQAYAAVKGFIEFEEGPWFRTPKTGKVTDILRRGRFYRFIMGIFPRQFGERKPQLEFSLTPGLGVAPQPSPAFASANRRFDQFRIAPKRIRIVGKTVLVVMLTTTLVVNSMAMGLVPAGPVYAAPESVERVLYEAEVVEEPKIEGVSDLVSVYGYRAEFAGGRILFGDRVSGTPASMIVVGDNQWLSLRARFMDGVYSPLVAGQAITYEEDGMRLVWEVSKTELKETIILDREPLSAEFAFALSSQNLGVVLSETGVYEVIDGSGRARFSFSEPTVVDAEGKEGVVGLIKEEEELVLSVDESFLKEARYPVIIDPSMVYDLNISTATAYPNQRKIVQDSFGNLLAVYVDSSNDARISYINSGNTAWIQYATAVNADVANVAAAIDSSGNLHVTWAPATDASLVYYERVSVTRDGSNNITGFSQDGEVQLETTSRDTKLARPSIIVDFTNDMPAVAWAVFQSVGPPGGKIGLVRFTRCKAGGGTGGDCNAAADWIGAGSSNSTTGLVVDTVSADHDQEITPVLVQMPDPSGSNNDDLALYVFYTLYTADDLYYAYRRWSAANSNWSATSWTAASIDTTISASNEIDLSATYDESTTCNGTVDGCVLVAYRDSDNDVDIIMYNAAGTADTSTFDPSSTAYQDITLAAYSGEYTLIGTDSASDEIVYKQYVSSWSSEFKLDAGDRDDATNRYPSSILDGINGDVHTIYTTAGSTPFRVEYAAVGDPDDPSGLTQYKADHESVISTGGSTTDGVSTNLYLDFDVSSPSKGDILTPKVEVEEVGTGFDGTATATGTDVIYDAEDPDDVRGNCVVYDSLNKRLVSWGGLMGNSSKVNTNDTWALNIDDGWYQWELLDTTGTRPTASRALVCVYDDLNDRLVVYGNDLGQDNVWFLSLPSAGTPTWSKPTVTNSDAPDSTPRVQGCAVYDSVDDRMILYGDNSNTVEEVYALTLPSAGNPTFSEIVGVTAGTPSASGEGRDVMVCVYDADSDRMILFGGFDGTSDNNDLWELDLASGSEAWNDITPASGNPGAREAMAAVFEADYSSTNDRMIIFGGWDGSYLGEVWEVDLPEAGGESWTDRTPSTAGYEPQPRGYGSYNGVYDDQNERALFFGGYDGTFFTNEVIAFDLTDTSGSWDYHVVHDARYLRERDAAAMIYDSANSQAIMFGGSARGLPAYAYHVAETWKMDTTGTPVWRSAGVDVAPLDRELASMVYDPNSGGRGVMCMGLMIDVRLNDCWELSLPSSGRSKWTQIATSGTAPTERWGAAHAYDSTNDQLVFFGGESNSGYIADLDFLSLPDGGTETWSSPSPSGSPPSARWAASGIYDASNNRMIIFGGYNGSSYFNTTFALNLSAGSESWDTSFTGGPPAARRGAVAVYDSDDGGGNPRMILFGGVDGSTEYNDVWELNLSTDTWSEISLSGFEPSIRRSIAAAADTGNDVMIINAGRRASEPFLDDTWKLSMGSSEAWTRIDPLVTVPATVPVTGLSETSYHWQAWTTGDVGDSGKVSYGGNGENEADFVIPERVLAFLVFVPLVSKLRKRKGEEAVVERSRWRGG